MSDGSLPRAYAPVAAHLRPQRRRNAARVVILHAEAVLLLADTDPGLPGTRWWVTPGGGIDAGESAAEAAVRELAEETGLLVEQGDLLGPVAVREVVHGYSDRVLRQREEFFVLRSSHRFSPTQDKLTAKEQVTLDGWAWLPLAELHQQPHPVWPANLVELANLADQPHGWPHDFGVIEESTVPVR
jgi:8-oxo-dGTP pyrophosphatase MutT (NUDIX family)